jgi:type VI secretion system secreted protein VgrG
MIATYTQEHRAMAVLTPLPADTLLLLGFSANEGLSQLFSFRLDLVTENYRVEDINFDDLMGKSITVVMALPGENQERYFNGICNRLTQGESDETQTSYSMEVVPRFWLWTRRAQSRIFQHLSVPDILEKVLDGLKPRFELRGSWERRDFCVQYRETDFNFASRLMEEEGIFYFFEHTKDGHRMVVANTPSSHPELPTASTIVYRNLIHATAAGADIIYDWSKSQEITAAKVTLRDHCFELPHKHLEAMKEIPLTTPVGRATHRLEVAGQANLELYDWPGEYAQRFDGVPPGGSGSTEEMQQKIATDKERTAKIRMEQEAVSAVTLQGASNCRQLVSGHRFTVTTLREDWITEPLKPEGTYVLTAITHSASLSDYFAGGAEFDYSNSFSCIPLAVPFRPHRTTPKPVVPGSQTAVVVGPPGQEICTDKYGRVKVQFHWDREGKSDDNSSCWVRVAQPWAGKRWGTSFWPRVGQEVVVDFLEGDPDQPIIVGSVYNAEQMPPYLGAGLDPKHKNDNKVSGIKTNTTPGGKGYNELRFDDTQGKEQVFVHGQRNLDVRVKNESMEQVGSNRHLIVGGEKDGQKHGDQRELVYQDRHLHVKRHHVEQIEGDMQLLVGGGEGGNLDVVIKKDRKTLVEGSDHAHVKKDRSEKVDGTLSLTVGGSQHTKVGQSHALEAGTEVHVKAGATLILEAGAQLSLKVGGNFIDINPGGVCIQGTMVMINSGGAAGSGSGAQPAAPQDAQEAKPTDPTEADASRSGVKSAPG